jgi:hypothetical protein
MPAVRFFTMLKLGRRLNAIEKLDQVRIMGISIYNDKYIESVKQYYSSFLEDPPEGVEELLEQEALKKEEIKKPNVFEAGSNEAKIALFSLVASTRG